MWRNTGRSGKDWPTRVQRRWKIGDNKRNTNDQIITHYPPTGSRSTSIHVSESTTEIVSRNLIYVYLNIQMRDIVYLDTIMKAGFNIPVDTLYAWTSSQRVTQVKVDLTDNYTLACLYAILTPHSERLNLSRMHAQTGHLSRNLWSQPIVIISTLPRLQYCRLTDFTYCIDLTWGDNLMQYFILPGHGRIPCNFAGFKLLFSDGSGTIELDSDGLREKLTDLANYVRAAEDNKRQQITNDGFIQDDIVRVIIETEE